MTVEKKTKKKSDESKCRKSQTDDREASSTTVDEVKVKLEGSKDETKEVHVQLGEVDTTSRPKVFTASQGRLRKLFTKSGLSGRISKDVFNILDGKIKNVVDQKVKELVIKDKKIIPLTVEEFEDKSCELPITPFRDYIKFVIKREYDISRIPPDVAENLHYMVEKDIIKLCQYAQDIMKNSSRKTLFANDIEVASKALLKDT